MCKEKMRALTFKGLRKSRFALNLTDGRTDISNYRVASLLKIIYKVDVWILSLRFTLLYQESPLEFEINMTILTWQSFHAKNVCKTIRNQRFKRNTDFLVKIIDMLHLQQYQESLYQV